MFVRCVLACALIVSGAQLSQGQARDSWLMKNYRLTGPPAPGTVQPTDPVISELRGIQSILRSILRRANSYDDYEAALAAAFQATSNAQLIGVITQRLEEQKRAATAPPAAPEQARADDGNPPYLIALKDKTITAARAYWEDGTMLNYITVKGAHVIVRLDQVDLRVTNELNRQRKMDLRSPQ